ncbi:Dolichyl-diphosphooligosaccharide--protein glycosyltransferase subunit WBP1 [Lipomyces arxii]|uniref:Dolichyl-diphosphooligosaccharide--protein glycosyltransferase subunit WBP1 n=1 Tax=Lipomyces arxii TaxID=56418 RepID=UPI0034CEFB44
MFSALLVTLCITVSSVLALSTTGSRALFVADSSFNIDDYTVFLGDLKKRGFKIDIRSPLDPDLSLFIYGERNYDHVILTLPSTQKQLGPNLLTKPFLDFISKDGNVLILLNPEQHAINSVRDFAREIDIQLPFRDIKIVDHFNYDADLSPELHDVLVLDSSNTVSKSVSALGGSEKLIYPSGQAFVLGNNDLIVPILRASETAYTFDPTEEMLASESPFASGTQAYLVAGIQTRNNARAVIVSTDKLFSDDLLNNEKSANRKFATDVAKWVFQESGVIRLDSVTHNLINSTEQDPYIYRVKQDVEYEAKISEYVNDKWVPYIADDVQLEFTMLDPYYRITLSPSENEESTSFKTTFTTPDQHGMFTFKLNYKRTGLSYIEDKRTVVVRHFGHNEFLRSFEIPNAYPYITSILVVIGAWFLFILLWIFCGEEKSTTKKTD